MPPLLPLYLRTFVLGVFVAAPVGAMGMLCIQRTLERGWRAGMTTGLGIATADGIYAALAAFGVAAVASVLVAWQTPLRLVGGGVLVYLGIRSILAKPAACDFAEQPGAASVGQHAATYASAVGLTLTNPMTIMAFGAVFASAGLVAQPGMASAAVATAGIASGSLSWWLVLATGVTLARAKAGSRLVSAVSRISGAVIVAFGLIAIVAAFWPAGR
ncbi:MAG: LysE family transporter [Coriobacteriia bacterium]|nr:LysE family transporter [Coriobacteriia bacterium]